MKVMQNCEKKTHKGGPLSLLQKVLPLFYFLCQAELESMSEDWAQGNQNYPPCGCPRIVGVNGGCNNNYYKIQEEW